MIIIQKTSDFDSIKTIASIRSVMKKTKETDVIVLLYNSFHSVLLDKTVSCLTDLCNAHKRKCVIESMPWSVRSTAAVPMLLKKSVEHMECENDRTVLFIQPDCLLFNTRKINSFNGGFYGTRITQPCIEGAEMSVYHSSFMFDFDTAVKMLDVAQSPDRARKFIKGLSVEKEIISEDIGVFIGSLAEKLSIENTTEEYNPAGGFLAGWVHSNHKNKHKLYAERFDVVTYGNTICSDPYRPEVTKAMMEAVDCT